MASEQETNDFELMSEKDAIREMKSNFSNDFAWILDKAKCGNNICNQCIPIGFVPNHLSKCINAECRIVRLSIETLQKQMNKHSDVLNDGLLCFESIQYLIDYGLVIKEGRNNYNRVLLFLGQLTGNTNTTKWYKLAIKSTIVGHEMYLTSFHPINLNLKDNIIKNGRIIRPSLTPKPIISIPLKFLSLLLIILSIAMFLLLYK